MSWLLPWNWGRATEPQEERKEPAPAAGPPPPQSQGNVAEVARGMRVQAMQLERKAAGLKKQALAAKKAGDDKKARALMAQHQALQKRVEQMRGTIANLEQHDLMMESALTSAAVVGGMRDGNTRVRAALRTVNADEVHEIAAEAAELAGDVRAVEEALATPIDPWGHAEAEADLDKEMAALDDELAREVTEAMPDAPRHPVRTGDGNGGDGGLPETIEENHA